MCPTMSEIRWHGLVVGDRLIVTGKRWQSYPGVSDRGTFSVGQSKDKINGSRGTIVGYYTSPEGQTLHCWLKIRWDDCETGYSLYSENNSEKPARKLNLLEMLSEV